MRVRRMQGIVLLVAVLVAAVACSGDGDGDGGDDGAGLGLGGDGAGIAGMLTALPAPENDPDDVVRVAYGDVTAAAEVAGVEPPDDPADGEAVRRYLNALSGLPGGEGDREPSPVSMAWPEVAQVGRAGAQLGEFADDVGWTILDVDRYVERQTVPESVTVLDGRFESGRLDEAMGEPEDDVWIAGDPDGRNLAERSPARPLGEPLWHALEDDRLVVAGSSEAMEAARGEDGAARTPTLADHPLLPTLAEALDGEDVYTAMLFGGPTASPIGGALGRDVSPGQIEGLCEEALAEQPVAVAAGLADDEGPVIVFVFLQASESAAEANAERIEHLVEEGTSVASGEPWSERLEVDRVTTDGPVMVARLRPTEAVYVNTWLDVLLRQDSLIGAC